MQVQRLRFLVPLVLVGLFGCAQEGTNGDGPESDGNTGPSLAFTATPASGQAPLQVQFNANADDPDGNALTYSWSIAGQTFEGGAIRGYTFIQAGTFQASVTVSDGEFEATDDTTITVTAPPSEPGNQEPVVAINATPLNGDAPLSVSFTSTASDPDGDPLTYLWDFGDSETAVDVTELQHTYERAGVYNASLTISDGRGGIVKDEVTISVTSAGDGGSGDDGDDDDGSGDGDGSGDDDGDDDDSGNNASPKANAGADQPNIVQNATVTLNGSGTDSDGTIASYSWTLIAPDKSNVSSSLSSVTAKAPTFQANQTGAYVASLKVKDNDGAESAADTVNITVVTDDGSTENQAPTADAGRDQPNASINTTVTLNGTGSSDPDVGETAILKYAWTLKGPGNVDANSLLNNESTSKPTFRPTMEGNYVASLVVTDSSGLSSSPDTVTVTVIVPNTAPTANAGADQKDIKVNSTVTLDGSSSSDLDTGETATLKYVWTLKAPGGGNANAALTGPTTAKPTFTANIVGNYVAFLQVTDARGKSSSIDDVTISVIP